MLRLARVIAIAAASGVFLAAPPLAAHAAVPTSSCTLHTNAPEDCTTYESQNGVPSEVSDVVPTFNTVPARIIAFYENHLLNIDDPHNWSDVVEFVPTAPGSQQSTSVMMLSVGCGNLNDPTDITCFPPRSSVFAVNPEAPPNPATGNDFTDCSTAYSIADATGHALVAGHVCSEASADAPVVPEAPTPILLPIAALGVFGLLGFRRLRRRST
jgi:hypothetical protein